MSHQCDLQPFSNPWSRWFFTACILFVLYLSYKLVEPYLIPIFLAVVLVVVAGPLYDLVLRLVGRRPSLAAGLTCLVLTVAIALPFFLLLGMLTSQALQLYTTVSHMLTSDELQRNFREGLGNLAPVLAKLHDSFGVSQADVLAQVGRWVQSVSNFLYANLTGLLRGFTNLVIGFALVLFVTFYLLMDGSEMAEKALALSPLPPETNQRIKRDILHSLRTTLKGTVVLALIQGIAGGVGFGIFGVPNALFWGTVMVFASVVPLVGTALVWAPGGIYLLVTGNPVQGVGVMVWCLAAGLICDNLLRPRLIGRGSNLHPLLTFFSVLGGLSLFGVVGLILGPLVLAVLLSLLDVYQRYFLPSATAAPSVAAPTAEKATPGEGA